MNGFEVRGKTKNMLGYVQVNYYMYSEQIGEGRYLTYNEEEIQDIVTKQQFEQIKYKVKEN